MVEMMQRENNTLNLAQLLHMSVIATYRQTVVCDSKVKTCKLELDENCVVRSAIRSFKLDR